MLKCTACESTSNVNNFAGLFCPFDSCNGRLYNFSKKEIVYTAPYETEVDKKLADALRSELSSQYSDVQLYPNGASEARIVVCNE